MPDAIDPYKVLQVDREAEDEVITAAYRRLARKYHPDLAVRPDAAARMASINAAWELIGEPAKRAAYDRLRQAADARAWRRDAGGQAGAGAATGGHATAGRGGTGTAGRSGTGAGTGGTGAGSGASGGRPTGGAAAGGSTGGHRGPAPSPRPGAPTPPPDVVSRDWTSGRSSQGSGFDESMRTEGGFGAAGPPPGRPDGRVLNFGRYAGWSLGEIARQDLEYIEWLERTPIGRPYRDDIDRILRSAGRRRSDDQQADDRRGLYRRR